jgi:hypothetical protein
VWSSPVYREYAALLRDAADAEELADARENRGAATP